MGTIRKEVNPVGNKTVAAKTVSVRTRFFLRSACDGNYLHIAVVVTDIQSFYPDTGYTAHVLEKHRAQTTSFDRHTVLRRLDFTGYVPLMGQPRSSANMDR